MGLKIDARLERGSGWTVLMNGLGTPKLQQAAAAGLNEHMRLQERQIVRLMAGQTKIPAGRVASVTRRRGAGGGAYTEAAIVVQDAAIPLGQYTFRSQTPGGVTAGDWNTKTYPHTFTIKRYGGFAYRRVGRKRFPVQKVWGPVLPNEALRTDQPAFPAFERFAMSDMQQRVLKRVMAALGL
jgi:hypothetical protein